MILVVGAAGTLGREVVARLLESGHRVRALTRRAWSAAPAQHPNLETVRGDLTDRASLVSACRGIDALLASAHALMGSGDNTSEAVDDLGHRALVDVAKQSGVRRFVYVSARGATPEHPVDFFRTKARIEQHVQASGLNYSILRPSAFMESHVHQFLGQPLLERGSTTIFGDGANPINFVSARDVATFAVAALNQPEAPNEIIEIGGPSNLSRRDIADLYQSLSGRRGKVRRVRTALLRVMRPVVRPFNPVLARLLVMSVWLETEDQTFDVRASLPGHRVAPTTLEGFVRGQIDAVSRMPGTRPP